MQVRKITFERDARPNLAFRIFGALLHRTFGDFVDQLLFAATVKEHMPNSTLDVYYRPDRDYKEKLVRLVSQIDRAWTCPDGVRLDYFDIAHGGEPEPPPGWTDHNVHRPNLVLTPTMCRFEMLHAFPKLARFRLPDPDTWDARLAEKVGPGWFVVVHGREPGYKYRGADPRRDFDPAQAGLVYETILRAGGQVVRIGHPGMRPLPDRAGLIDLSAEDLLLQTCAIKRSRFFLEFSPSGPVSLALPFGVPSLRCNQSTIGRTFEDMSLAMPMRVLDGAEVDRTWEVIEAGTFNKIFTDPPEHLRLTPNSIEQILKGVTLMLSRIKGDAWRDTPMEPSKRPTQQPDKALILPFSSDLGVHLLV